MPNHNIIPHHRRAIPKHLNLRPRTRLKPIQQITLRRLLHRRLVPKPMHTIRPNTLVRPPPRSFFVLFTFPVATSELDITRWEARYAVSGWFYGVS